MIMNKSNKIMKVHHLLYLIIWMLVPLLGKAQATPPPYSTSVQNTVCGGTVKVDWSAAVAAKGVAYVADWWAELYDNSGANKQSQQAFDSAGKAEFKNLSSGTYKVKLVRKDGTMTHPTVVTQAVVSTYRRFVVDAIAQTAAERATGECTADGKVTVKIKDGAGPFIVKLYEVGQTAVAVTSAPTNKTGNETNVLLTGLKPNTKYEVEITDQVGGGSCSITENRSSGRSFTTLGASGSFLHNVTMETSRPLKSTETQGERGLVKIEINNASAGAGPFSVKVVNKTTGEVIIASQSINKSGATGTTSKVIEPDGGKKLEANKTYQITVTDGSCTAVRTENVKYTYSAEQLRMHLVPSCSDCNEFNIALEVIYQHSTNKEWYYPYLLTMKVTRGGVPVAGFPKEFTSVEAIKTPSATEGSHHIYGNREFRYWNWKRPFLHTDISEKLKVGDVIELSYKDGDGKTKQLTHTVEALKADMPLTQVKLESTSATTPCTKRLIFETRFQYNASSSWLVTYNAFCNVAGIKARTNQSGTWSPYTEDPLYPNKLFKYYDGVDENIHRIRVNSLSGTQYKVEYAEATATLDGTSPNSCKHYLSKDLKSSIPNSLLDGILVRKSDDPRWILQVADRGSNIIFGADDPNRSGLVNYITETNHLKVKIEREDGKSEVILNSTGPWNLAGTYKVKFPFEKEFYPSMNEGVNHVYVISDLPTGKYKITMRDGCGATRVVNIDMSTPLESAYYDLKYEVKTDCSKNGQDSRGEVTFTGIHGKYNVSPFNYMFVFKDTAADPSTSTEPLYKRTSLTGINGSYIAKELDEVANPDASKRSVTGKIGNLPPGNYILGINPTWRFWYTAIDKPEDKGYTYGYKPNMRGRRCLGDTMFYQSFTITNYTEITPIVGIGMCDPSNPSTGIVKVELPSGASPQFPITYTLYKVVGGVRTVVMKAGVPVKKTITTRPANMEDANALFSDIEKLGAGEGYEVKFESGCFDKWIPVPDFGSLASPTVRSSSATQCAGRSLTLSVDLPASLY
ncbi:hypothetical protein VJJ03_10745, partial [Capnocytophaga sp. G2]|nr:hypothetical protein [Capnocytophaga sp. G2]